MFDVRHILLLFIKSCIYYNLTKETGEPTMARVTSTIEFYEHVPIPTDFKNEPLFKNKQAQINYFNQFKNKKLTFEGSYQRVEEQIKTKFSYEELVNVNYVHVKNPSTQGASEGTAEWWGFVMDIHYINDGLVTVDWVVDPIQTFMFDWELNQAFIERGMVKSVLEDEKNKRYIDDKKVSILTNSEPVGVDGLAYYLTHDNLMDEGDAKESRVAFMVLLIGDSENQTFVGVPSQIDYYVLPFDKKSGAVYDFEIKNVQSSTGKTTITSTNNGGKFTIHAAIAEIANDMELTKGGKAILTSYIQNEIGFDFKVEGKKVVATMSNAEWKYEGTKGNANVEVYNVGKKKEENPGGGGEKPPETGGGNSDIPSDRKEFLKKNINTQFKVNEQKFIEGAKQSARVRSWLGNNNENIKRVADIVRNNGMSPELFFAYDIQEQGTSWGWLNHTAYTGDPYSDADSVSKWAVSQANTGGAVQLAWTDVANPYYTTPPDKQAEGQAFANALPIGAIGRMYLSGTAAATWAAFDPEALKGAVNGVQDYGDPIQGCMDVLKSWQ